MKRITILFLAAITLLLFTACAPPMVTLQNTFPKMYQTPPVSIMVLPPVNKSTAADAKEYFACSLAEAVGMKGYYILPVEAMFGILRNEGLYDTENITPTVLTNLKKYYGADAVLYSSIEEWEKGFGSLTITAKFALLNTADADTLWNFTTKTVVNIQAQSDNIFVALVETAVKTALEDYFPNCLKANLMTMDTTMPYGKHHPEYTKDAEKTIPESKYGKFTITK
jgi:hypothetical protein